MKDFFGQELEAGDKVVVLMKGYRCLVKAEISHFTPKGCRVEYYGKGDTYPQQYQVFSDMIIKQPESLE